MECEAGGIRLEPLPGDRLDVDAPARMLTAELVAALREHKAGLLRLLAGVSAAGDPPHGTIAVGTLGESVTGAGDDGSFGDCPVPGAHGSAAAPVIGSQDLTCPRCASVRIGQGRRWLWCIDCETRIGPVIASQDLPDAAPAAIPDDRPPARSGWRLPPWPPVVPDAILADPPKPCGDCGRPVGTGQPGRPAGRCFDCWQKRTTNPPTVATADNRGAESEHRPMKSVFDDRRTA